MTTNWFPDNERSIATMIGTQMNVFGVFVGFLLPGIFMDSYEEGDFDEHPELKQKYKDQMFNMLLSVSIFSTVITLLVLFTFREKKDAPLFGKKQTRASTRNSMPRLQELSMLE